MFNFDDTFCDHPRKLLTMKRGENLSPHLPGVSPHDCLLDSRWSLHDFADFQFVLLRRAAETHSPVAWRPTSPLLACGNSHRWPKRFISASFANFSRMAIVLHCSWVSREVSHASRDSVNFSISVSTDSGQRPDETM